MAVVRINEELGKIGHSIRVITLLNNAGHLNRLDAEKALQGLQDAKDILNGLFKFSKQVEYQV